MPRRFENGIDLRGELEFNGSPGNPGETPYSQGPNLPPLWLPPIAGSMRIDASEFIPSTTAGCGIDSQETTANRVNRDFLTFDPGTRENAIKWFTWPIGWNAARCYFIWTTTLPNNGLSATFGAEMYCYSDGESLDSGWGTAQEISDAAVTVNTHRQTAPTAPITPGGSVAAGRETALRIYRNAGADDLNVDALVAAVVLERAS